jgi:hypothetical protein
MKTVLWMASLGAATLFLTSCGGDRAATNQQAQTPNSATGTAAQSPVPPAPTFDKPIAAAKTASSLPAVPVPGLLQPTNAQARLSQISTQGKRDPFAAVLPDAIQLPPARLSAATPSQPPIRQAVQPSAPQKPQTIAQAPINLPPITPLQNLPPLPISQAPLPIAAPPVSRTNLADAVEITGVVQVGGKVTAIVQSPDEATARYVQAGDYLANGRVLLKRIIMSKNGEPTIVLQQNGIEVTKSVGSTSGPIARAL